MEGRTRRPKCYHRDTESAKPQPRFVFVLVVVVVLDGMGLPFAVGVRSSGAMARIENQKADEMTALCEPNPKLRPTVSSIPNANARPGRRGAFRNRYV
jgi:hypothetical protein